MLKQFKFLKLLSIPLILKYIFLLLFISWDLFYAEDVIEDLGFFIVIGFLVYGHFFKAQFYTDLVCVIYLFYLILETTSYIAVSSNFSSSFMYLLLESNTAELNEFGASYISVPIVLVIIIFCSLFFLIRRVKQSINSNSQKIIGLIGVICVTVFLKFTGFIESNAYHNAVRGTYGYFELQNSFKLDSNIKKEDVLIKADNEVLVFVLGESTARGRMQLYGYEKETTPLLSSMEDSLFVYNNAISTEVFTLKAVPKIITSQSIYSDEDKYIDLVQIFNSVGYKTYWLSNQRPISYHDNAISKIASASSMFKFYNHNIDKHANVLDEVVFDDYNSILNQPGKKVVFVRLLGTHFDYHKRYPKAFNRFALDNDVSKETLINNQYDNAVLYNDFIVYNLIQNLNKINKKSALVYTSDHGENIFDGTDFFGRSEEILTKSMFEVPFFLWTSKDFIFPIDFMYDSNRKFIIDHTFESIGHVFGIIHKDMKIEHSIFSKSFKERKRKVLNKIDFDTHF